MAQSQSLEDVVFNLATDATTGAQFGNDDEQNLDTLEELARKQLDTEVERLENLIDLMKERGGFPDGSTKAAQDRLSEVKDRRDALSKFIKDNRNDVLVWIYIGRNTSTA